VGSIKKIRTAPAFRACGAAENRAANLFAEPISSQSS
jgi:uncharacterized membrane-anchored protein